MSVAERFVDTNVLLYLLSSDERKADLAEKQLLAGSVVSVQVLNEFVAVATRKFAVTVAEAREALAAIRAACVVVPLDEPTHDKGLQLAERFALPVYDAMIIAAALLAGCKLLLSEDFQHGQIFDGRLKVRNPFL